LRISKFPRVHLLFRSPNILTIFFLFFFAWGDGRSPSRREGKYITYIQRVRLGRQSMNYVRLTAEAAYSLKNSPNNPCLGLKGPPYPYEGVGSGTTFVAQSSYGPGIKVYPALILRPSSPVVRYKKE
jgi:hypothetical protein